MALEIPFDGEALLSQHADEVNLESAYEVQKLKDEPHA